MGKVTRWLRSLLGHKTSQQENKTTRKWSLAKSADVSADRSFMGPQFKNVVHEPSAIPYAEAVDANKHAIAVAAATAAVAEAALAAAHAAAEVFRLTTGGVGEYVIIDRRRMVAAVKIQSAFRACLARRAFRALKGLVKLQALVRGRIVRNRSIVMLRRMQAMARIQARASTNRSHMSESSTPNTNKFSNCHPGTGFVNLANKETLSSGFKQSPSPREHHSSRSRIDSTTANKDGSNLGFIWLDQWMEQSTAWSNNKNMRSLNVSHNYNASDDKILEIDTWKPRQNIRQIHRMSPVSEYFSAWNNKSDSMPRLSSKLQNPDPSISSEEVSYMRSPLFVHETDRPASWTAGNSPIVNDALSRPASSHRRLSFGLTRNKFSTCLVDNYFGHPNYMANTESSLAKLRSHSVPRQRMQPEDFALGGKLNPVHM